MREWIGFTVRVVLGAGAAFGVGLVATNRSQPPMNPNVENGAWSALVAVSPPVLIEGNAVGSPAGRSAILVHDYTCPACQELYRALEGSDGFEGMAVYGLAIPVSRSNEISTELSVLAWCAGKHKGLGRAHVDLTRFGKERRVPTDLSSLAMDWGIPPDALFGCVRGNAVAEVEEVRRTVVGTGIAATPTMVVSDGSVHVGTERIMTGLQGARGDRKSGPVKRD
jgi:hypothetical protein